MNYIGIDGNIHSDELKHWKYIKKVKTGEGYRYFYSQAELDAYYQEKLRPVEQPQRLKDHWKKLDRLDAREEALNKQPRNRQYYEGLRKLSKDRKKLDKVWDNKVVAERRIRNEYKKASKDYDFSQKYPALHEARVVADLTSEKAKNKVAKGKSKAKKIVKTEAAGTKRVLNATRGKGNNSYSVDGKTYNKYDRKKQRLGKKKYKTSKLERAILKGYRATHPYE